MFLLIYKENNMKFFNKLKNNITDKYKMFLISIIKRNKKQNVYYKNSTTKHSMNESCTMELSSATKQKKAELEAEVKNIVKQYFHTPEKLIQYIKTQGNRVYKINKAEKILARFGEEEGFITPVKGFKALLLNAVISASSGEKFRFDLQTKEMFIFDTNNTEIYTIARALYKYYGYQNNLPGYDYNSQSIFKKIYNTKRHHSSPFTGCSINDMYACKEAIARDMESINFTIELSTEYENSKKAAMKIETETGANI